MTGGKSAGRFDLGGVPMGFAFPTYRIDSADAYERGRQHGEVARAEIDVSVQTYRRMFQDFVKLNWDEAKAIATAFAKPIAAYDPDLLEEINGIADGSGYERAEILALNARSEIALSSRMLMDGCTAFAAYGSATPSGETVLCQNWDWRATQREALVAMEVVRPGRPVVTMLTEAGIIGKIGFNSDGLGVCLNAIVTDQMNPEGTPLHVVLRKILEARSIGEAIMVVGNAKIASAANFLIAQPGSGAIDIEATPSGIGILLPDEDTLVHTNHLLSDRLAHVNDLASQLLGDSYPRLVRARSLVAHARGSLDLEAARSILRDHGAHPSSICRHGDEALDEGHRMESVVSIVMALDTPNFEVSDGPPCSSSYAEFEARGQVAAA
jgi:isopenicillin-N N-acyltransferase-like protein